MSRLANRTAADVADLFEPGSGRDKSGRAEFVREFWRLFGGHLRSINSSPISHAERVWCHTIFVFEWIRRHRAPMWIELFKREYIWK
jgi:hypothetical protein